MGTIVSVLFAIVTILTVMVFFSLGALKELSEADRRRRLEIDALAKMLDQKQAEIDRVASRISGVHSDLDVLRSANYNARARQQRRDLCCDNRL